MSELDLLRKIADLEARLARLESAGAPYTTTSAGAMTTPALNVGSATGATTGQIKTSGEINVGDNTAGAKSILLTPSTDTVSAAINFRHGGADKWIVGTNIYTGDSAATLQIGTGAAVRVSIGDGLNVGSATGGPTGGIAIQDGITAPAATAGAAKLYVDTADGDLKIIFGDGTIKTIATDT